MTQSTNFRWPQGEDLNIQLRYSEGTNRKNARAVDLTSDYSLRMDIVDLEGAHITTVNSSPEVFGNGQESGANINLYLPRTLTLTGGVIFDALGDDESVTFLYDCFLRNTATDKQVRILRGSLTVEASRTLWL